MADVSLIRTLGKIAGIGGIAFGLLIIIFGQFLLKSIFPSLSTDQAYNILKLLLLLTFAAAVIGIIVWATKAGLKPLLAVLLLSFAVVIVYMGNEHLNGAAETEAQSKKPQGNEAVPGDSKQPEGEKANNNKERSRTQQKICEFYGEAPSGGTAWHKQESCLVPQVSYLDTSYHQSKFVCCGGGATSPATAADIPAGLEIITDGGYYWAVLSPQLVDNYFKLITYCGPAPSSGPGCNVKVQVWAHYKIEQKIKFTQSAPTLPSVASPTNTVSTGWIAKTVIDSVTGQAVADARVSCGALESAITDSDGKFLCNLPPHVRRILIGIEARGYKPFHQPVPADSNAPLRIIPETTH